MKKLCEYCVFDMRSGVCLVRGQKYKDIGKLFYVSSFWYRIRRMHEYCTFRAISGYYLCIVYWVGNASKKLGKFSEPSDAGFFLRFRGTRKNDIRKKLKRYQQFAPVFNDFFDEGKKYE